MRMQTGPSGLRTRRPEGLRQPAPAATQRRPLRVMELCWLAAVWSVPADGIGAISKAGKASCCVSHECSSSSVNNCEWCAAGWTSRCEMCERNCATANCWLECEVSGENSSQSGALPLEPRITARAPTCTCILPNVTIIKPAAGLVEDEANCGIQIRVEVRSTPTQLARTCVFHPCVVWTLQPPVAEPTCGADNTDGTQRARCIPAEVTAMKGCMRQQDAWRVPARAAAFVEGTGVSAAVP